MRASFPIWTRPSFLVLFVLFGTFPIFFGIFPICPGTLRGFSRFVFFPFSRPINSAYREQSRKGLRHNLDLSRKKWETHRFANPPVQLLPILVVNASPQSIVTGEHWTGSPKNKSIDQIGKNCPQNVQKLCLRPLWTILGVIFRTFFRHFSDIFSTFFGHFFDIFRTFCRHFSDILSTFFGFSGLSNDSPITSTEHEAELDEEEEEEEEEEPKPLKLPPSKSSTPLQEPEGGSGSSSNRRPGPHSGLESAPGKFPGKPPKKARIFSLKRTPKIPGKEGKNAQKSKEIPCDEKSKEIQKSKERKIRVREVLHGVGADGVGVKFPIFAVNCCKNALFCKKGESCVKKGEKCVKKGENCVKKGENHSNPIYTNPIKNLPINGVGRGGGQTVFNQILTRFHGKSG